MVQWLRICLAKQGTQVPSSLVQEDAMWRRAVEPVGTTAEAQAP